jgi:DNA-binding MarR family transcriptional regulator
MQPCTEPLGLLVAAIRHAVKAQVLIRVEPLGLSPLQFWVLVGVLESPAASQAALARRLRFDEPTVSRVVAALAGRGWVLARRDAADRRRVLLGLTPSGRTLALTLAPIAAEVRRSVEAPLEPAERERVRDALARIADHLQQLAAGPAPALPVPTPRAARRRAGGAR